MGKQSEINIKVSLDDHNVPEKISWNATDAGFDGDRVADSMVLSIWDSEEKNTLSMGLWTKDMIVDDMFLHTFQTLHGLSRDLERATGEADLATMLKKFTEEFGVKANLITEAKKEHDNSN